MADKQKVMIFYNKKGGTLKTTIATSLAYYLSEIKGKKTLLIDLDEQGTATYALYTGDYELSSYDVIMDPAIIDKALVKINSNLDLVPASNELESLDQDMKDVGIYKLDKALSSLQTNYDYVICDLPPKTGCVVANAFCINSAKLYIPVLANAFSNIGLQECLELAKTVKNNFNKSLSVGGIIFTLFTNRNILSQQYSEGIKADAAKKGVKVYTNSIRSSVKMCESQSAHQSIFSYMKDIKETKKGDVRTDFINLFEEMGV